MGRHARSAALAIIALCARALLQGAREQASNEEQQVWRAIVDHNSFACPPRLASRRGSISRVRCRASPDVDPWAVLEVPRTATIQEIRRAYRKKALREHPDVSKEADARARWIRISAAYELLSDPAKRERFEQQEQEAKRTQSTSRASTASSQSRTTRQSQQRSSTSSRSSTSRSGSPFTTAAAAGAAVEAAQGVGRFGKMALDELLQVLDRVRGREPIRTGGGPRSSIRAELVEFEQERKVLEDLSEKWLAQERDWQRAAERAEAAGDKYRELDAVKQVLAARERRKSLRDRLMRCYENIQYFRSVVGNE